MRIRTLTAVNVVRCELAETPAGWSLGVRMGDELLSAELLPDEAAAHERARAIRDRLMLRGWLERE